MKWGSEWPKKHDLTSLRLLGTVGEPINPEAWMWYREMIGGNRCPIVDTWWQTETGAIMIAPVPGAVATKPGSATRPLPGIIAEVVTRSGERVPLGSGGYLVIKKPWPSMLRTVYGDPERYVRQYWTDIPGMYFTGDGAREDADGCFWIMGRVDDVLNVSGHRLSTMEIESALVAHEKVAEAAVVGRPDETKGQAVAAFVTLESAISAVSGVEGRAARLGSERNRFDGEAGRHSLHRSIAEDPFWQDHAAPAARAGFRRRGQGRHDHAGGYGRDRTAPAG